MVLIELKEVKDTGIDHKYCLRCGRKLKNVEARKKGYGAICEKKMEVQHIRRLFTI